MMRVCFVVLSVFVSFCLCQEIESAFAYSSVNEPETIEPYIEFNIFEGSYTSNSLYGTPFGLHLCVDKNNQLSGSYDEVGILQGFVINTLNDDGTIAITATGNFFEAGTGACITGDFELDLTSWGFNGTWNCGGNAAEQFIFMEDRTNSFRPSDEQCAVLDRVSDLAIEGSWENIKGFPLDACLTDTRARMSYLRRAEDANLGDPLIEGYIEGTNFLFGKVVAGTWYEEEAGGAILFFIRDNGNLAAYRWSGLLGDQGRTVIDPSQARQEEKHQKFSWNSYYGPTKGKECNRFGRVKTYLLDNLPQDDDDFYYFVNDDYFDEAVVPEYYAYYYYSSSASAMIFSVFTLFMCLLIVL